MQFVKITVYATMQDQYRKGPDMLLRAIENLMIEGEPPNNCGHFVRNSSTDVRVQDHPWQRRKLRSRENG